MTRKGRGILFLRPDSHICVLPLGVGDNLHITVAGCRQFGLRTVHVKMLYHPRQTDERCIGVHPSAWRELTVELQDEFTRTTRMLTEDAPGQLSLFG